MSVNYNVLGLVFASMHDSYVSELTKQRTMGSIPFGGRYRLIDFPLSSFVNSGITEVGVITKSNYGSLLDHLGSGRDWDLARKKGGLHLLPPYSHTSSIYRGRLDALNNIWRYVEHSNAKYVIMSNCDVVTMINFDPVLKKHKETEADITLIYSRGYYNCETDNCATVLEFDQDNRLKDTLVDPQISGECNLWLEMCVITKDFLKKIVAGAASRNQYSFTREILQGKKDEFKIMGYKHDGFFTRIDSIQDYYNASRLLLNTEKRNALFAKGMPVLTKIGDNGPVKYGLESNIKDSLIADGCIIEGTVINSILFRGVKIGKDSVVKDCVLFQGTKVGTSCSISSVITDKNVEISNDKVLTGSETYPLYIGKGGKI